ncbi:MAG: hypothetical protein ACLTEH_06295 [Clostridia bacterium]
MKKISNRFLALAIIFTIFSLMYIIVRIDKGIQFNTSCNSYITAAVEAESPQLAKENLAKALTYLESNKLTSGNSSILRGHRDDISRWYQTISNSYTKLNTTPLEKLEKSNYLIQMRKDILMVNHPSGISICQNKIIFLLWKVLAFAGMPLFFILYVIYKDKEYWS